MNKILMVNKKKEYLKITLEGTYLLDYNNYDFFDLIIEIAPNIEVKLITLEITEKLESNITYLLHENSHLTIYKFYHIKEVNENIAFDLNGASASINYYFRSLSFNKENYHLKINHNSIKTNSLVNNKVIGFDQGDLSFELDSNLGKNIYGSTLSQDTIVITLDEAKAVIKPNMFIENDDVMARHGSVIGTFNEEQIFYLMSRGLDYNSSIKLLIKGILLSDLEIDLTLKEKILNIINMYWR